jgi:hypothetical protein
MGEGYYLQINYGAGPMSGKWSFIGLGKGPLSKEDAKKALALCRNTDDGNSYRLTRFLILEE